MASALSPRAINALYFQAFGRNANRKEMLYWQGKQDTSLRTALEKTPSSKTYQGGKKEEGSAGDQLTGTYKDLYEQMKDMLDEMKKRGQILNPNIEITEAQTAEFMKIAESEVNPYYETQFKLAREGFLSSLGYDRDSVLRNEADLERKYGKAFKGLGEQAAESGFAQSGMRQKQETELTDTVQRSIFEGRNALESRSNELARAFGQSYGGSGLRNIQAEGLGLSISNAPRVGDGSLVRQSQGGGLYSLDPNIYDALKGSQEFQQTKDLSTRTSELESAFRTREANEQLRNLYI